MKTLQFVFFLLLIPCAGFSQSTLLIDSFKSDADYYSAFNNGSGTVTNAINYADFYEGNSSLSSSYSFQSGSGFFFSSLRNYATVQQDYSFQTTGFSIHHKNGHANDSLSIRLWEDQNGNGAQDADDEVYESSSINLGSTSWTKSTFSLGSFIKIVGSGNGTLDLNRIRAWDVKIANSTSIGHNGTVLIDRFSLESSYSPPSAGGAKLTGSFIQLWNTTGCSCGNWTQQQWEDELMEMKAVGLSSLIVQYSVYNDLSWYSPCNLSFVNYKQNTLNKLFLAAEKAGLTIHLGLYFDEHWNSSNKSQSTTYSSVLTKHKAVIDELWNLFGMSNAFGGWYIPQELNDLEWQVDPQKTMLFNWVKEVSAYAKTKSTTKPVMIAPFFNLWQPADQVENWYNELLSTATDLDRVYPQDGVGITLKNEAYHIPLYFAAIKRACDAHGKQFGATIESFHQTSGWPVNNAIFAAQPTTIVQLKKQLWAADEHTPQDLIGFSWSYMQPNVSANSLNLYTDYQNYVSTVTSVESPAVSDLMIYPNPTRGVIEIKSTKRFTTVKIYTSEGKLLNETSIAHFSMVGYAAGLYFLQFAGPGSIETRTVVKE